MSGEKCLRISRVASAGSFQRSRQVEEMTISARGNSRRTSSTRGSLHKSWLSLSTLSGCSTPSKSRKMIMTPSSLVQPVFGVCRLVITKPRRNIGRRDKVPAAGHGVGNGLLRRLLDLPGDEVRQGDCQLPPRLLEVVQAHGLKDACNDHPRGADGSCSIGTLDPELPKA